MIPFRFGSPEQFAALRTVLRDAGYTTGAVCERAECPTVYDFRTLRDGRSGGRDVQDGLDVLIRLFMDGEVVSRSTAASLLPPGGWDALAALDLVRPTARNPDHCTATVLLYPTESLYIASDLEHDPDSRDGGPRADAVYPAITKSCQTFVSMLPDTPCDDFLELCAGTGIAALIAARRGAHACAVDITERSTQFARFNARLNGLDHVTALRGDLYEPVAGRAFDRIVAHPPYMPSADRDYIYRDGGLDGEQVTRRIVAGLHDHLRPGGTFHCTCIVTDRKDAPLEWRVREMLGEHEAEFDLVVATTRTEAPHELYRRLAARGRMSPSEAESRARALDELGVVSLVVCSIVIRRHTEARPAITVRRRRGPGTLHAEIEWLLRVRAQAATVHSADRILDARPRISPHARLTLVHRPHEGHWVPEACSIAADYPFPISFDSSVDAAMFLARCDGTATVRDHLLRLREGGAIESRVSDAEFAGMLWSLIDEGVLQVPGFELPDGPRHTRAGREP